MPTAISGKAAIAGLGITEMTREYTGDATTLALRAIALALEDAGLTKDDLDGRLLNGGADGALRRPGDRRRHGERGGLRLRRRAAHTGPVGRRRLRHNPRA